MITALLLAWIGAKLAAPWWFWCFLGVHLMIHLSMFSVRLGNTIHKTMGDD